MLELAKIIMELFHDNFPQSPQELERRLRTPEVQTALLARNIVVTFKPNGELVIEKRNLQ